MVSTAPIGSTTPESTPPQKAFPFFIPSARRGMEMIAPSGKFWMAMPSDSANAPAAVIWALPDRYPAYTTPTAIPSGMLWRVTASTIMVVRRSWLLGPSVWPLFTWRWGTMWSRPSKKRMPIQKPATAGTNESLPIPADCSMAGISRLHTEAATITPAAKPVSDRCTISLRVFFIKNTQAAPNDVPRNGIKMPQKASIPFPLFL